MKENIYAIPNRTNIIYLYADVVNAAKNNRGTI